jgi:uncharacterized protein
MIIDFSTHLLAPALVKQIRLRSDFGFDVEVPPDNAEVSGRIKVMDKYGVDMQVLSLTTSTLIGLSAKDAEEICKSSNQTIADFCNKRPDRFAGLAAVSLLDVESGIEELVHSVEDLGLRGAIISTNQAGKGLDSQEYFDFYERICKYDIPLLLHPSHWGNYPLVDGRMMTIFGWPFDTTQAIWRLLYGGVFDAFPKLKVVTHHLGGMLPYFNGRIKSYTQFPNDSLKRERISDYWTQVYGDTAIDGQFSSFMTGYSFFGPDRIVYGSDYPFGLESGESFIRENIAGVRAMSIPEEEKTKIFEGNCRKLLKLG